MNKEKEVSEMDVPDFVHLHVHSEYSVLDGITKIQELPSRVKELGMSAVAITDHGSLGGTYKFYKACKEVDVKPILGCELYMAIDRKLKGLDANEERYYHLTALAMNETGRKNLTKLVSLANRDGFYYKGRIDNELLESYNEGIAIASSCLGGIIAVTFRNQGKEAAEKLILYYKDLFKDRFFLELQDHPSVSIQTDLNLFLQEVSLKYNIPPIVTGDCHYLLKEDGVAKDSLHEQILAMQTQTNIHNEKRFTFDGREHWVKSPTEVLASLGSGITRECLTNTVHVANMCTGEYFLDAVVGGKMPHYLDIQVTPLEDLTKLAKWGLVKRFDNEPKKVPQSYKDRLDYELRVIDKLDFTNYFLILNDIVQYADKTGILRGPGRGSAAGSLLSWALTITSPQADPMKYGLYFERFLNPDRKGIPDVDLDFSKSQRHLIHEYIKQRYGEFSAAHLGTFRQFKPKSMMRDFARAQGFSVEYGTTLSQMISDDLRGRSPTMEEAIASNPKLSSYPHITNLALKADRLVSGEGVHASGYIIYHEDLSSYLPIKRTGDFEAVTQFDMADVEEMGFVKFDILGISNLDVIAKTLSLVKLNHKKDIDINTIDLDDKTVYDFICEGKLLGIFQLEGSLKNIAVKIQPRNIEDISAINSIGRPGPLDAGYLNTYLAVKSTGQPPENLPTALKKILQETNYVFLYQEQVMKIAIEIAGFTLSEADSLRKSIGKKIVSEMDQLATQFKEGCKAKKAIPEDYIEKLWSDIEGCADYLFNKSHAICYSLLAYQQAWLKCYYPAEFMTALMSVEEDIEKVSSYISESRALGLDIIGPNINESDSGFRIKGKNIIFGLSTIKGMGATAVKNIISARGINPYKDFMDFISRVNRTKVNIGKIEVLIKAGAFDSLGYDRKYLLDKLKDCSSFYKDMEEYNERLVQVAERTKELERLTLAGEKTRLRVLKPAEMPSKPVIEKQNQKEIDLEDLNLEKEVCGAYLSMHPTDFITQTGDTLRINEIYRDGTTGILNCIVSNMKVINTKTGKTMAFLEIEDQSGRADLTVFPDLWTKINKPSSPIESGTLIRVKFKAENIHIQPIRLIAEKIRTLDWSKNGSSV